MRNIESKLNSDDNENYLDTTIKLLETFTTFDDLCKNNMLEYLYDCLSILACQTEEYNQEHVKNVFKLVALYCVNTLPDAKTDASEFALHIIQLCISDERNDLIDAMESDNLLHIIVNNSPLIIELKRRQHL